MGAEQSVSAVQPHDETAGSADSTHLEPSALAAHSSDMAQPHTFCAPLSWQCGPRGLAAHSASAAH
jgi:hypothetical protein